ncbi:MAG: nicotinate-nucleotide diphosphorylase (carboxylating), partial [bacterium]|nr:nicotinate-nucleotide diphosphorylase (carboxylating) [bacterium]
MLDQNKLKEVIDRALVEDVADGDITTLWTVREGAQAHAEMIARAPGVVAGLDVARAVFEAVDSGITLEARVQDGDPVVE